MTVERIRFTKEGRSTMTNGNGALPANPGLATDQLKPNESSKRQIPPVPSLVSQNGEAFALKGGSGESLALIIRAQSEDRFIFNEEIQNQYPDLPENMARIKFGESVKRVKRQVEKHGLTIVNFGNRTGFGRQEGTWILIEKASTTESALNGKSKNARDLTKEEKVRRQIEKAKQRERGEARIDQANQLQQVPIDFTNTILLHLKNKPSNGNGKKPLGDLSTDFQEVLMQSSKNKEAVKLLIAGRSSEQLQKLIFLHFVKALNDILTTPKQETFIESIERRRNAKLIQELGGIAKIVNAVREHFFPVKKKVVATSSSER